MKENLTNEFSSYAGDVQPGAVSPAVVESEVGQQASPVQILDMGLKELYGEDFDINDEASQEILLHHLKMNNEQNEKLAMALERDPRLAQMLADMIEGKRNAHTAMARYFGNSILNVTEDSPEFEEMLRADEERRNEVMRAAADLKEYEKNLDESRAVIEAFCKERGYDAADFMNEVWEKLVMPILSGNYSHDVCVALEHALNYEKDVEDAFAAGDIKGRNTNIRRLQQDFGDGMPKGMNSVAPETAPRRRRNSLIEDALNA